MSGLGNLLALAAAAYVGKQNYDKNQLTQTIKSQDNDWTNNLRQRDQTAYQTSMAQKAQLADAAAPVVAVPTMAAPDTADDIDVGTDPSAAPTATGAFTVAGVPVADQTAANAAVTQANTPTAQMGRMAAVMNKFGDPVGAATLNSQATQAQVAQLQLNAAQRADVAAKFNADLNNKVHSFSDLGDFITNSNGDGQAGAMKVQPVASADGKTIVMNSVGDDGTLTPQPTYTYPNTAAGLAAAKGDLLAGTTPEMQLTHLHQQALEKIEADKAANEATYQQGMLKNAGDKTAANIEIASMRLDAANSRAATLAAAKAVPDPVTQIALKGLDAQSDLVEKAINGIISDPGFDPAKPPAGLALLQARAAGIRQRQIDLVSGGRGAAGLASTSNPLGIGAPPPAAPAPLTGAPVVAAPAPAPAPTGPTPEQQAALDAQSRAATQAWVARMGARPAAPAPAAPLSAGVMSAIARAAQNGGQ